VGWKEIKSTSWRGLIQQNQNIHISFKLQLSWLISYRGDAWTSHTSSQTNKMLTQLHKARLETFNYKFKIDLTRVLNSSSRRTPSSLIASNLLILTLFNLPLLMSTLLVMKAFQISNVMECYCCHDFKLVLQHL
jgi:hypothetical protein